jgi:hypothetical protein
MVCISFDNAAYEDCYVLSLYPSPPLDSTTGTKEVQFKDNSIRPEYANYGISLDLPLDTSPTEQG